MLYSFSCILNVAARAEEGSLKAGLLLTNDGILLHHKDKTINARKICFSLSFFHVSFLDRAKTTKTSLPAVAALAAAAGGREKNERHPPVKPRGGDQEEEGKSRAVGLLKKSKRKKERSKRRSMRRKGRRKGKRGRSTGRHRRWERGAYGITLPVVFVCVVAARVTGALLCCVVVCFVLLCPLSVLFANPVSRACLIVFIITHSCLLLPGC